MAGSDKSNGSLTEDSAAKENPSRSGRRSSKGRRPSTSPGSTAEGSALREEPPVELAAEPQPNPQAQSEPPTTEPQLEPAITEDWAGEPISDPEVSIVEAAVTPEFEILEELGKEGLEALEELGGEGLQTAEAAVNSLGEGFWKFSAETANYTKESLDCGSAYLNELLRAKSLPAAVQIRIDYAKSSYVRLLNHLLKMNGLYWSLVEEASKSARKRLAKAEA